MGSSDGCHPHNGTSPATVQPVLKHCVRRRLPTQTTLQHLMPRVFQHARVRTPHERHHTATSAAETTPQQETTPKSHTKTEQGQETSHNISAPEHKPPIRHPPTYMSSTASAADPLISQSTAANRTTTCTNQPTNRADSAAAAHLLCHHHPR